MYLLLRKILFLFDAEMIHVLSLKFLSFSHSLGLLRFFVKPRINSPTKVMGIEFPNMVGLAAGLDKNAEHIDALSQCGFGFIEVGTVTPLAQAGNEKPRLFRLQEDNAIINRMGFNNIGVDALIDNICNSQWYKQGEGRCVLGINIGKNKATPLESAVDDYLICMAQVYSYADYITINISSPNTPGLRELQHGEGLTTLLTQLKTKQAELATTHGRYVPLAVKIAPDLDSDEIRDIANRLVLVGVDAVIVSNTTNSRPSSLKCRKLAKEEGGLSGQPIFDLSTDILRKILAELDGKLSVIAVGGISSADDALQKVNCGANLVQIYTGFIYSGPMLIHQTANKLR